MIIISKSKFMEDLSVKRVLLLCKMCGCLFFVKSGTIRYCIKNNLNQYNYCSKTCRDCAKSLSKVVVCRNCGSYFEKRNCQIKRKPESNFCNRSCAATFNNNNKKHGIRVSRFETGLKQLISSDFPGMCDFNNTSTIGRELDLYFKDLFLAIEINGIHHYKPIHGIKKLIKISNNDITKNIDCQRLGINLVSIDISSCKQFTQKYLLKIYPRIKRIINKRLQTLSQSSSFGLFSA